jgi:DHA1 family bicyclomycin/chloramphenicol resistance-like MFS transporter
MLVSALLNLGQALLLPVTTVTVVAPVALYVLGMALAMPNINLMALDCFPHNRGMASAVQSFVQMTFTALVVGVLVPLVTINLPTMTAAMLGLSLIGFILWQWLRATPTIREHTS